MEFRILNHIGVIKKHDTGWAKELNFVQWNGQDPKYDIREWSEDHKNCTRGLCFSIEEMIRASLMFSKYYYSETKNLRTIFSNMDAVGYAIHEVIGAIRPTKDGWTRLLTLTSWNDGEAKYDFRDWNPDFSRMGRGLTLTLEEMENLNKIIEDNLMPF